MATPLPIQAGDSIIQTVMTSAANGTDYVSLARPGVIKSWQIVNSAAVATANLTVTLAYVTPGGTSVAIPNGNALTLANAAAAGTVANTATTPTSVQDGGTLTLTRSGGATGAANLHVSIVVGV